MIKVTSIVCASLLVSAAACKKEEEKAAEPAKDTPATVAADAAKAPEPAAVSTKTPEERVARFEQCWGFFNDKKWDEFKGCFTDDAESLLVDQGAPPSKGVDAVVAEAKTFTDAFPDLKGEPQLVLAHENHIVGVVLMTGTHQAPLKMPAGEIAPTGKKVGYLLAHVAEVGDEGKASKEWSYWDGAAMMGQLGLLPKGAPFRAAIEAGGEKQVVIAKGDEAEAKNVAAHQAAIEAYNKHDAKAYGATIADDAVISGQANPADQTKKEMVAGLGMFWKGFPDFTITPEQTFGAGDYTVAIGKAAGTNKGDIKAMGLKKTNKPVEIGYVEIVQWKDGKQAKSWLFYNGAAFATQLGLTPEPGKGAPAEPATDKPAK